MYSARKTEFDNPVIAPDGTVYLPTSKPSETAPRGHTDVLVAIAPSGKIKWRLRGVGAVSLDSEGTIYGLSRPRSLLAIGTDGRTDWTFRTPNELGDQHLVVGKGRILCTDVKGNLYAISRQGRLIWRFACPAAPALPPILRDLTAAGPLAHPLQDADGTVYVADKRGRLYALDGQGNVKWATDLGRGMIGDDLLVTPGPRGGRMIIGIVVTLPNVGRQTRPEDIGPISSSLFCVDDKGRVKWRAAGNFMFDRPNLAVSGDKVYATGYSTLVAFDLGTGARQWSFKFAHPMGMPTMPAVDNQGTIYAAAPTDDPSSKEVIRAFEQGRPDWMRSTVYAFRPDGSLKWRKTVRGARRTQTVIGPAGRLYFATFTFDRGQTSGIGNRTLYVMSDR